MPLTFYKEKDLKRLQYTRYICLFLLSIVSICWVSKEISAQEKAGVKILSTSPVNPILKNLATNPILRIAIEVPAGSKQMNYRKIQVSLNAGGLNAIKNLEVYFTDTSALFSEKNKIMSILPPSKNFIIPVDIMLAPGIHYIWLSASIKEKADIDQVIELHAIDLADEVNKKQLVTEDKSGYKNRTGITIRKAGDENVNTYRIPGITRTDKGTLISVYDIRYNNSKDLPENIDVGMNRSIDGGKTWQPMKVIMDMGAPHENNGVGDPAILFDPVTKKIWVAALWSKGNKSIAGSGPGLTPDETGQFVVVSSNDDGITWTAPASITSQVKDPAWKLFFQGPGNGIAMRDGKIVFPAQYWDSTHMPYSTLVYSDDHGATWKRGTGAKSNTTESQVVETTPGTLMLNMRDNRGKFRSVATTTDMGHTWKEHSTSYNSLPDPVCMASIIKVNVKVRGKMKEVLFFSNPNTSTTRKNITIKASLDLGETWLPANELLIDERRCYGYSALTMIDDKTIGLVYEGTKDIYFVRVPVSDIIK